MLVVFLGPTLDVREARCLLDAVYLPPAAQGDVYRAARQKPFAIGIVDGYFERLPAVWHKEILWALSRGIHVFGAASMGALRAAELDRYGMRGVGAIYRAFAASELTDDDEVAVAHGDADTDYRPLSHALVNMRVTLHEAVNRGLIDNDVCVRLIGLAKEMFYPDRCYPHLFQKARTEGVSPRDVEALERFVKVEQVDQKRQDARELLAALRNCAAQGEAKAPVAFSLAHTDAWQQVVEWAEAQPALF